MTKPYSMTPHVTHCKRGHLYTEWNALWSRTYKGTLQRGCKLCRYLRLRLRYRDDPAFREKMKQKTRRYRENARGA